MILNAVVELADSYGGSISASVRVRSFILPPLSTELMPDRFRVCLRNRRDEPVDSRCFDTRGQLVGFNAAFVQREVIGEQCHSRFSQTAQSTGGFSGRKHTVLDQKDRDRVAAFLKGDGRLFDKLRVARLEWVSRFDKNVSCHSIFTSRVTFTL